jgi:oxygen-independent coproporphyrinogen-3 oxidase
VNRVSLGVQSMQPHVLQSLGRTHDVANVHSAAALARDTFPTFNLDVIYGGAGETIEDWRHTLEAIVELQPPHVSAYALTIESGTPLADDLARHPDDDDQADKYLLATELLGDAGLDWYEISNWARPGHECRHNWLYWSQGDYLGVGCAAHSHRDGRRWWNVRTPERYIDAVETDRSPEAGGERLEPEEREIEALQLSLRTRDGVPSNALPDDPDLKPLVALDGGRATLTVEGRLLANEVALRLRHPISAPGSSKT